MVDAVQGVVEDHILLIEGSVSEPQTDVCHRRCSSFIAQTLHLSSSSPQSREFSHRISRHPQCTDARSSTHSSNHSYNTPSTMDQSKYPHVHVARALLPHHSIVSGRLSSLLTFISSPNCASLFPSFHHRHFFVPSNALRTLHSATPLHVTPLSCLSFPPPSLRSSHHCRPPLTSFSSLRHHPA